MQWNEQGVWNQQGLGVCLDTTANMLFDTWFNLSQPQVPYLGNGDNNPHLTGSLGKFKRGSAECLASDRCSL